ncbi:AAA ATPase [Aureococcus anophagefferens]|nr:AAA ATPase [Aureococcus anophagefferens]
MAPARRGSRGSASTAGRSSTGRKSVAAARPRCAGNYDDDDDDDDEEEEAPAEEEEEEEEDSSDESSSEESEAPPALASRRWSADEDEPAPKRGRRDLDMPAVAKIRRQPALKLRALLPSSEDDDDDDDGAAATRAAPKPRALMNVTGDTPNNGLGRPRERKRARSPQSPTSGGRYKADSEEEAERRGRRRENLELPSYGMDSPERGGRDRRGGGRRRWSAARAEPYFSTSDSSAEPRPSPTGRRTASSSAPVGEDSSSDDDDDDDDARPGPAARRSPLWAPRASRPTSSPRGDGAPALKHPNLYASLGVAPPRGVLFHGPPGTGKTLLARQLAEACSAELVAQRKAGDKAAKKAHPGGVSFFVRNGADCLSKYVGEAERALSTLFEEARSKAPSIIFFDELDGLAPAGSGRGGGGGELAQHSVVATLLALMDGLSDRATPPSSGADEPPDARRPLRRPGRFDREQVPPRPRPALLKKAREAFWALGLGEVAAAFRAGLEAAPARGGARGGRRQGAAEVDEVAAPSPAAPREPGEKEAHCLRELRVFLRATLRELKADRSLQALWRPVDPEESPEYFAVVQSPMDLSVVRAKVDGGLYPTLRHFLSDVRVVRENAAAFRAAALGHARADDLAHAAANAEDLASMAHRFQKKVGWDLVAKCDAFHKKRRGLGARLRRDAAKAARRAAPPRRRARRTRRTARPTSRPCATPAPPSRPP